MNLMLPKIARVALRGCLRAHDSASALSADVTLFAMIRPFTSRRDHRDRRRVPAQAGS
jgi:hypothetical protein